MKTMLPAISLRLLAFALLWFLIGGRSSDWLLVAVVLIAATAASCWLWPVAAWRWRLLPLLRFVPYFLRESVAGGIDVARRALSPRMPLRPALIEYPLGLRSEAAQVFFSWAVSLLPGSASVRLEQRRLWVHVLDSEVPLTARLRKLEEHVSALFDDRHVG
jgi:multicomponent Na+:H+ antiporter subunit E